MFGPGFTIVSVVAIVFGCWAVTSVSKHVARIFSGQKPDAPSSGSPQLTTSELEALVRRAVEEATRPLNDKIERLEQRLDAPPDDAVRRMEERDYGLIDEWPEEDLADADVTQTPRQRA